MDCNVCMQRFDASDYTPKIIPSCGHTLCKKCIENMIGNSSRFSCPFCKKLFKKHLEGVDILKYFPTNFQILSARQDEEKTYFPCLHEPKEHICTNLECKSPRVSCAFCVGRLHPDCLELNLIEKRDLKIDRSKKIQKQKSKERPSKKQLSDTSEEERELRSEQSTKVSFLEVASEAPKNENFTAIFENAQPSSPTGLNFLDGIFFGNFDQNTDIIPRTSSEPLKPTQPKLELPPKAKTDLDFEPNDPEILQRQCLIRLASKQAKDHWQDFETLAEFSRSTDDEFKHANLLLNLVKQKLTELKMADFRAEIAFIRPKTTDRTCLMLPLQSGMSWLVIHDESQMSPWLCNGWVFESQKIFENEPF